MPRLDVMEDVQEAMLQELRDGVKVRRVARKYLVTYAYVREMARKHNIKVVRGNSLGEFYPGKNFNYSGFSSAEAKKQAIIEELKRNDNMANVGQMFGMTRERVRQIAVREGLHPNNRKEYLHQQNVALLQPMLDMVATGKCVRCQRNSWGMMEKKGFKIGFLCDQCRLRRQMVGNVLSRLKNYLRTGNRMNLNQAAWQVRAYGVTIDDLRSY